MPSYRNQGSSNAQQKPRGSHAYNDQRIKANELLVDEMEDNLLETEFNFLANDDDQVLNREEAKNSYKLQPQQKEYILKDES